MGPTELGFAVVIALAVTGACLVLYLKHFDVSTGRLKDSSREALRRFWRLVPRLLLRLAPVAAAVGIIWLAVAYRDAWTGFFARAAVGAADSLAGWIRLPAPDARPRSRSAAAAPPATAQKKQLPAGELIPTIADHRVATLAALESIPRDAIRKAASDLHIVCVNSSPSTEMREGLDGLAAFRGAQYQAPPVEWMIYDPKATPLDKADWSAALAGYLKAKPETNVVLLLWGEAMDELPDALVQSYLDAMARLEREQPAVHFVYATGSVDGGGRNSGVAMRNERIRAYCVGAGRSLMDEADLESYDPDGTDYTDGFVTRLGWYDSNGDHTRDRNWAADWQAAHPGEWYPCGPGVPYPVMANAKAYAAWWLFARLAGWDGRIS